MAETLTLKELKAQNAAADEAKADTPEIEDEYVEVTEEDSPEEPETKPVEVDETESEETEETETEETETLESWQQSEDTEDSQDTKTGFVPNAGAASLRRKLKDTKQELKQSTSEIEELRAEIAQLKQSPPQQSQQQPSKRPKLEDFDYDEAKHEQALDAYYEAKMDSKLNNLTVNHQAKEQELAANQLRESSVTNHYDKAAELVAANKIEANKFGQGDENIRKMLDSVFPGQGNLVAEEFISKMVQSGEGSEKAWYYIGNNPSVLAEFRNKVVADQTGSAALMFLTEQRLKASQPLQRKRSSAPPPPKNIKGEKTTGSGKSLYNAWKKAEGDPQTRIKLKRQAKAQGVDTAKW